MFQLFNIVFMIHHQKLLSQVLFLFLTWYDPRHQNQYISNVPAAVYPASGIQSDNNSQTIVIICIFKSSHFYFKTLPLIDQWHSLNSKVFKRNHIHIIKGSPFPEIFYYLQNSVGIMAFAAARILKDKQIKEQNENNKKVHFMEGSLGG